MNDLITLVIFLNNRHQKADRLLEYYQNYPFKKILADSSREKHVFKPGNEDAQHLYLPGASYQQKVEASLNLVETPYVVLCADDDFIIPDAINSFVSFLEHHNDYAAAYGKVIKYYKSSLSGDIRFEPMYSQEISNEEESPSARIEKLFFPYKAPFYAVHRTSLLKKAYRSAGNTFSNLYLNEYLISIATAWYGKIIDLPVLYQVREFADKSDDKTTINIDVLLHEEKHKGEVDRFLNLLVRNCDVPAEQYEAVKSQFQNILGRYASDISKFKAVKPGMAKKIGRVIEAIPVLGKKIIVQRRLQQSKSTMRSYVTDQEFIELNRIIVLLKKYSRT